MILDKLVQATQKRLIKQKQQKSLEDVKREALTRLNKRYHSKI